MDLDALVEGSDWAAPFNLNIVTEPRPDPKLCEIAQGAIDGARVLSNSSLDTGHASVRPLEPSSKVIVV